MANHHHTITCAVDSDVLLRWTEHQDTDRLMEEARATLRTHSIRDWLMSELSAFRKLLELPSLEWLATEEEAKAGTTEHLDTHGHWWFVWTLYRSEIQSSIDGLSRILALAHEFPGKFGANRAELGSAHAWDKACGETEFDMPDASNDGDDPIYVLCSILAFRRLLNMAQSKGLHVVHLRYSFRVR